MSTPETDGQVTPRQKRLRRRALKNLRTALGEAGDQLTTDWALQDRDLEILRTAMREDPGWIGLVEPAGKEREAKRLTAEVPGHRKGTVRAPAYPWHPLVVIAFWLAAFLGFGFLFLLALTNDAYLAFTVLAAIATFASAVYLVIAVVKRVIRRRLVTRRDRSQRPTGPPAENAAGDSRREDETAP